MPAASSQCAGSSAPLNLANHATHRHSTENTSGRPRRAVCYLLASVGAVTGLARYGAGAHCAHQQPRETGSVYYPSCRKHLLQSTEWGIMHRSDVICGELRVQRRRARPGPGRGAEMNPIACWRVLLDPEPADGFPRKAQHKLPVPPQRTFSKTTWPSGGRRVHLIPYSKRKVTS
jgi:hypothetical protein